MLGPGSRLCPWGAGEPQKSIEQVRDGALWGWTRAGRLEAGKPERRVGGGEDEPEL